MKQLFKMTIVATCLSLSMIAQAHVPTAELSRTESIAPMLQKVMPAVVNISVVEEKMRRLDELLPVQSDKKIPIKSYAVGSGVIFNAKEGLLVTNAHVVKDQKAIVVTLKNGERYHAKLVAKDDGYDIAILKIQASNLQALPFANSNDLKVGDFVTAIGSPYGLSQTVTSGMISALNRSHPKIEGNQSFIQTDAPINPGNSGGALVNMHGQLVGINTAMMAPSMASAGIGFAIPSDMAKSVIGQLLKYGKVKRGVLGVIVQNITPELKNALHLSTTKGAMVSQIMPGTPAATADLHVEDIITAVNGDAVHSAEQLRNTMGLIHPGVQVALTVLRNHKVEKLAAIVANPTSLKQPVLPYLSGMRLQKMNALEKDGSYLRGLMITGLSDASAGALAGLTPGDVITAVNEKPVATLQALQQVIAHQTKPVLLNVVRGHNNLFVVLNKT